MSKTAVYSWRVEPGLLDRLREEAARRGTSVAQLLDEVTREWLRESGGADAADEARQRQLHAAAAEHVGVIEGADPERARETSSRVRDRLRRRRAQ